MQKFKHLKAAFPSETSSLSVVIKADDVTAPAVTALRSRSSSDAAQDNKTLFPGDGPIDQDLTPTRR